MKTANELREITKEADSGIVAKMAETLINEWQRQCENAATKGKSYWEENISNKPIEKPVLMKVLESFRSFGYDAVVINRNDPGDSNNPWSGGTERFVVIRWGL